MAEWWEREGQKVEAGTPGAVFHDTDNLEYGNQGDTRYWDGEPGAVGSTSYDAPSGGGERNPVFTVKDPNKVSVSWDQPRQPNYGFDWSKVDPNSLIAKLYGGQSIPDPARGQVAVARVDPNQTGTSGGGQLPMARDGQTLAMQSADVQAGFYAVHGSMAPVRWAEEHNRAIGAVTPTPATGTRTNTPGVVTTNTTRSATTVQPVVQDQGSDFFRQLMEQLTRRAGTSGISTGSTASGLNRLDRAMAAIWEMDPGAKQLYQGDASIAEGDWKGAVSKYLQGKDPVQYAVDQGWISKPPPRTVEEAVDSRTLELLQSQGLLSPELLQRVNSRLEANYQLDAEGKPIPEVDPNGVGGSRFLPPIPSVQMWNGLFNQAEREGTGQLFQSLGLDPSLLMGEITRLAPPSGGSGAATPSYRRRVA